jgi:hypothetical protein
MHVGGRSSDDIDAGGILMRDGYAGYAHLPAIHAWCAAHLLRDLRALSDADPETQLWALTMAETLLEANQAAHHARASGATTLEAAVLTRIRRQMCCITSGVSSSAAFGDCPAVLVPAGPRVAQPQRLPLTVGH